MSSLSAVHSAEAALIATLKKAAAALSAVGCSPELLAAVAELEAAEVAAKARLEAHADKGRACFCRLAEQASGVAAALDADLFGEPSPAQQQQQQQQQQAAPLPVKQERSARPASEPETTPEPSERTKAVRNALDAIDDTNKPAPEAGVVKVLVRAANAPTVGAEGEVKPADADANVPAASPPSANGRRPRHRAAQP